MSEWRLFPEGTVPECATPEWYANREHAPHLEQEGHRDRLLAAALQATHTARWGAKALCDLGAGDGGLLSLVTPEFEEVWGYDLQQTNVDVARARRGVNVSLLNVLDHPLPPADTYVATEMLEHLVDPHAFVRRMAETGRWLVASSPFAETDLDHYEFHLWAWDLDGYRALLEDNGWRVLHQDTMWICQVVLAERVP